jgi:hypothetical protein
VKVGHVPRKYGWLVSYVGREGYIVEPLANGWHVEFDDGDVEGFAEDELTVVEEAKA